MLDPWRLRLLSRLASLGTVRAVAEAARLSPSSVSQQLSVLEREVGAKLFERAGRRLRLTPAGTALVRHARVILDQMDAARAEVAGLDGAPAGRVRVGAFTSAVNTFVLTAAQRLRERHPRLRIDVWELDPLDSLPALRHGECDVVVTADFIDGSVPIDDEVRHTRLAEDRIVLVRDLADADGRQGPADLRDFKGYRWSAELLAVDPRYRVTAFPLREPLLRHITAAVRAGSADRPAVSATVQALQAAAQPGSAQSTATQNTATDGTATQDPARR